MNDPQLLQSFCDYVACLIDDEGVYPIPVMWRVGDKTTIDALALDPTAAIEHVWRLITCEQATELIFALDRSTRPGQGTEFADVLTCGHWFSGIHESWSEAWQPFVINYQNDPRIVRPADFGNEHWNATIRAELQSFCPPFRIKTTRKDQHDAKETQGMAEV